MSNKIILLSLVVVIFVLTGVLFISSRYSIDINIVSKTSVGNDRGLFTPDGSEISQGIMSSNQVIPQKNVVSVILSEKNSEIELFLALADKFGFLSEQDITINLIFGPNASALLEKGQADASISTNYNLLSDYYLGKNIKSVVNLFRPFASLGFSRYPTSEVSKIKTAGILKNPSNKGLVNRALINLGVDTKNMDYIEFENEKAEIASLTRGEVDFILIDYFSGAEVGLDKKFTYFTAESMFENFDIYTMAVSDASLKKNGENIKKLIKVLYETKNAMLAGRDRTIKIIENEKYLSTEKATQLYDLFVIAAEPDFVPSKEAVANVSERIRTGGSKLAESNRDLGLYFDTKITQDAINTK